MPVVEPYPDQRALLDGGKVNMNCQIAPFTYITRDTALRGVLKASQITAVDDQFSFDYKDRGGGDNSAVFNDTNGIARVFREAIISLGRLTNYQYFRYPVHLDETLYQLEQRFANGDLYRSPSEICTSGFTPPTSRQLPAALAPRLRKAFSPPLPPEALNLAGGHDDANHDGIKAWWYANPGTTRKSLTGTNMRDKPYAYLYPRLTTKSNSYTVHFLVQTLKQSAASAAAKQWVEGQDQVMSEYRGSSLIERYIDPGDPNLPDFANPADPNSNATLDNYYRFRVVSTKKFAPQ